MMSDVCFKCELLCDDGECLHPKSDNLKKRGITEDGVWYLVECEGFQDFKAKGV